MKQGKANRVLPRKHTGHSKHSLPTTKKKTLHIDITGWSVPKSDWLYSLQPKIEKLYTVSKSKTRNWLWFRSWTPYCQIQTSVQFSCTVVSDSLRPHESQHPRPPCPSLTPGVHSDSRPLSQWCDPAISSLIAPFSSCAQSLPASQSFPKSQLFAWGAQSTGISALALFLPKKSQDWSPSEWTGWVSLQPKGLSRVFANTTVQKHKFFGTQLFSYLYMTAGKTIALTRWTFVGKVTSLLFNMLSRLVITFLPRSKHL